MTEIIRLTRSSMPGMDEYMEEIRSLWDSHWLTNMGSKHNQLQTELLHFLDTPGLELLTNGHMALELSMQALKLKGEVITTPFTFASTTHAIVRNGLTPVFCDINPYDFTMDTTKIESLITDRTCAIVPVHVYGNVCDVEEIHRIAKKYNLKVIYDAAHSFGVRYKGIGIGNFGDVSCFSFHATKVFHTIEGGAVSFHDKEFGLEIYRLKNFGIRGPETVDGVGANAKMNEFCAAMGICNLRHIADDIAKRKHLYEIYRGLLGGIPGLQLNPIQQDVEPNYSYFPIIFDENVFKVGRNEVCKALADHHVEARKYFYPITNAFECFHGKYDCNLTPVALHISKSVLTLPLYPELREEDVEHICEVIISLNK